MNANDARRSIFTLGRFQILAEAFEKLDKKGQPLSDSQVLKVTHMWGNRLEKPMILEDELTAFQFYAQNVIANDAFAPPPFVSIETKHDIKQAFKKLTEWEKKNPQQKPDRSEGSEDE